MCCFGALGDRNKERRGGGVLNCCVEFEVCREFLLPWSLCVTFGKQFCFSIYIVGDGKLLEESVCVEVSEVVLEASKDACGTLQSVF